MTVFIIAQLSSGLNSEIIQFEKVFFEVNDLNRVQIQNISAEPRKKYREEYSIDKISETI